MQFRELAVGAGSLWVLGDALDRRLWRLDARTGHVQATIGLPFAPTSVAVAGGAAWITDGVGDRVVPVDVASGRLLAPVRGRPRRERHRGRRGSAVGREHARRHRVAASIRRARRVVETIEVGGLPRGVAAGDGAVWVTAHAP